MDRRALVGDDSLGKRIAFFRRRKGYTQQELADKIGAARQTVWNVENGARDPSAPLLRKISAALEADLAELLESGAPRSASFEDRRTHRQLQTVLDAGGELAKAARIVVAALHSRVG